jgi:hypothetical protein
LATKAPTRGRPKYWTKERIKEALQAQVDENGYVGYKTIGGGLRGAAEREFGSWQKACKAARVKARKRGRPKAE